MPVILSNTLKSHICINGNVTVIWSSFCGKLLYYCDERINASLATDDQDGNDYNLI